MNELSRIEKACSLCGVVKPYEEYHAVHGRWFQGRCKSCCKTYMKSWKSKPGNRERMNRNGRFRTLKMKYRISEADYDKMFKTQGGVCAICGGVDQARSLSVDHNHETGLVRGLLCHSCNVALGLFHEDIAILLESILYLSRAITSSNN